MARRSKRNDEGGNAQVSGERWKIVKEIVASALDLSGNERSAYLDRACGADRDLRGEVDSLLAMDDTTDFYRGFRQTGIRNLNLYTAACNRKNRVHRASLAYIQGGIIETELRKTSSLDRDRSPLPGKDSRSPVPRNAAAQDRPNRG